MRRGVHIQQTDDEEQFDMAQYGLGLDDQLSNNNVKEVEATVVKNVGGPDESNPL